MQIQVKMKVELLSPRQQELGHQRQRPSLKRRSDPFPLLRSLSLPQHRSVTGSDMPVPDTYHAEVDESRVVATDLTPACCPDDVFTFKRSQLKAMSESMSRAERALRAASRMAQAAADCFNDEAHVAHDVKTTIDAVLSLR